MSAPAAIRALLLDVRRRLRVMAAVQAALYLASIAILLAVAAPLLASGGSARTAARLGLLAAALSLLGALALGLWAPARRWRDDRQVARWIGRRVPPLASDLLSSVELGEAAARPAGRGSFSPAMVGALVDSTARRLAQVDRGALVPRRPLWRPLRATGVAAGFALVVLLVAPGRVSGGWQALLAGEPGGRFAGAQASPVPLVGDLTLTLRFPAYTGREPVELANASGEVRVVPGTTIDVSTTALEPVTAGWIAFDHGEGAGEAGEGEPPRPDLALAVDGARLSGGFEVREPVAYRFLLEGPDRARRVEAAARRIEIDPDREPSVELHAPAEELDVTGLKRIELAFVAEDDYGLTRAELVWTGPDRPRRMPLELPPPQDGAAPKSAQNKILWDLADVPLEPGARITYHLEVFDNDGLAGPKAGRSRSFTLRVLSPRERHERLIAQQRELFENMVTLLGGRLTVEPADPAAHELLHRATSSLVVELGTAAAALEKDELAAPQLIAALTEMRGRIDKLVAREARVLKKVGARGGDKLGAALSKELGASNRAAVSELEDDVILLADWLDRQDLENLLAITDEIKGHQDRLARLFEEYRRTGSPEIAAEIEREMRALEQRLAELSAQRGQMPGDVLDQFVNAEALQQQQAEDCLGDVRRLLAAGDAEAAERRMRECAQELDQSSEALEKALDELRGDKFSEQQRAFEELRGELADLAQDQRTVAEEADQLQQRYAEQAADLMKQQMAEKKGALEDLLGKLRRRVDGVPRAGVGQYVEEELQAVDKRLEDIARMLGRADLAEALAMAREAEAGLEVIEAELESAVEESDRRFRKAAERALDGASKALPLARRLVQELEKATPSPGRIMDKEDLRRMERLGRRQQALEQRAEKLGERARGMAEELPGESGPRMADRLGEAAQKMERAAARMRMKDPSGARQEAREAAEKLSQADEEARGAARLQQRQGRGGLREEPIRIPGADEYRAPEKFREDILDAMKKDEAPPSYKEMVKRYYEELIR